MANPHPSAGWKKGQSGNPKGSPKKDDSLTGLLRQYMDAEEGKKKDEFIRQGVELALAGDSTLYKYFYDRLDGQMKQEILMQTTTIEIKPPPKPGEEIKEEDIEHESGE